MRRVRLAVSLLLLGAGCALPGHEPEPEPSSASSSWVTVERGDLVVEVDVSGTLKAVDSVAVGPPGIAGVWNYKLAMMAPEGGEVKEGDTIVAFDTSELDRKLEQKQSERDSAAKELQMKQAEAKVTEQDNDLALAQAQAELRKATLKAEAPPEITSVVELNKARLDLSLATEKVAYLRRKSAAIRRSTQADIASLRSVRDRAEQRVTEISAAIGQMQVKAPRAGTVIYETNWRGEKKKVGDGVWRAETVLHVASLERMEAEGEVDEVDAARVTNDQVVSLRLDSQADVELRGRIREISRTVQRQSPDNPLKVVRLKIALEDDIGGVRLRPGMRFRGHVEMERIEDVLLVPLEAVVSTPEGPVVYRRGAGGLERVAVTLGRRNATMVEAVEAVEAVEGLREGDELDATPSRDEEDAR